MYILPKNVLSELPVGVEFVSDQSAHLGECKFSKNGQRNALAYALYAGGIAGGYYLGGKLFGMGLFGKLAGAGAGYFAAAMIEFQDLFCEGF